MVAGGDGEGAAPGSKTVRANAERLKGAPERLKFEGVRDDGSDLVLDPGDTAVLTDSEWRRVKGKEDDQGRKFLQEA